MNMIDKSINERKQLSALAYNVSIYLKDLKKCVIVEYKEFLHKKIEGMCMEYRKMRSTFDKYSDMETQKSDGIIKVAEKIVNEVT